MSVNVEVMLFPEVSSANIDSSLRRIDLDWNNLAAFLVRDACLVRNVARIHYDCFISGRPSFASLFLHLTSVMGRLAPCC